MRGRIATRAEVIDAAHNAFAEELLPDAIHDDASGERIAPISDPVRELHATTFVGGDDGKVVPRGDTQAAAAHFITESIGIASNGDAHVGRLRDIVHGEGFRGDRGEEPGVLDLTVECLYLVRQVIAPLLERRPAGLFIANRSGDKAETLAGQFSDLATVDAGNFAKTAGQTFDVVINATSASLAGDSLCLLSAIIASTGYVTGARLSQAGYPSQATTYWGIALATYRGSHIGVDLLWEHCASAGRRRIDLAATALTLAFLLPLAWMVWVKLGGAGTQATSDLRLPLVWFYAVSAAGVQAR